MEAALALARQGLPVFPCRDNKAPATPHGFKDASTDVESVRLLWKRYPGPLIGVPTGAASGFDVVDLDPRHGAVRWFETFGARFPQTRIHATRSGGWHIFFRAHTAMRNSAGRIGPGVDVRGEGGFIIWWPISGGAVVDSSPIAPWPKWLWYKAMPPRTKKRPDNGEGTSIKISSALLNAVVVRALHRVRSAPSGQLHYQLRAAACTLGGIADAGALSDRELAQALHEAAEAGGALDMKNADNTIKWGLAKGRQTPLRFEGSSNAR